MRVEEEIALFQRERLEPARIPPPSVAPAEPLEVDGISATARLLRPEEAEWNRWTSKGSRLFNNRAAMLFEIRIEGPAPVRWRPEGTRLELNDQRTILTPAPSGEVMLGELLFYAYLEEQWAIEGDLVDRTRGAGPFRAAYLPAITEEGPLVGVLAFPLGESYDVHVVAMRLTLAVATAKGTRDLVWLFE